MPSQDRAHMEGLLGEGNKKGGGKEVQRPASLEEWQESITPYIRVHMGGLSKEKRDKMGTGKGQRGAEGCRDQSPGQEWRKRRWEVNKACHL